MGHATNMEKIRMHTKFWSENLKGRHYLGETGDNRRILKWVRMNEDEDVNCFHTAQSGTKTVAALFKQSCLFRHQQ